MLLLIRGGEICHGKHIPDFSENRTKEETRSKMKFDVLGLLAACSYALDCVEAELIKVTNNHSKRVAYMAVCTAEKNGYTGSKPAGSGRVCIAARQCSGTIYSGRASK